MAIMIPSIPQDYEPASGEDKVFYALQNLSGDSGDKRNTYYVFHSFIINRVNEDKLFERHEIDFVIFHPKKGILCLECKNGKVMSENRVWYYAQINNKGFLQKKNEMPHGGPFRQAKNRMQDLLKVISDADIKLLGSGEKLKDYCKVMFAVCFPGVESLEEEYKIENGFEHGETRNIKFADFLSSPEFEEKIVIFGEDLRKKGALETKIESIFGFEIPNGEKGIKIGKNGRQLQNEDIKNLFDKVLCPNFNIVEMVDDDDEPKYIALNNEQQNVLKIIRENDWKEAAISGLAGTGKTVLAMQLAKEKARDGKVLFLCTNNLLWHELKKCYTGKKVDFTDIDWIREDWLKALKTENDEEIYEILTQKVEEKKIKTIIVDEGQDFGKGIRNSILFNLYRIMRGTDPSWCSKKSFYIFYDEWQKDDESRVPEFIKDMEQKISLRIICRNIPNIAKTALRPRTDLPEELCQRVRLSIDSDNRRKVKIDFYKNADEMKVLLERIIDNISLKDNDTVILTCKNDWSEGTNDSRSDLTKFSDSFVKKDGKPIKNFKEKNLITYYTTNSNKKILFTSWKKFKGLDRKNVVLTDFEPDNFFIEGNNTFFSHFYVGVTRARDNCYILAQDYIKSEGFESSDLIRMAELYYELKRRPFEQGPINIEYFWAAFRYIVEKRKDSTLDIATFVKRRYGGFIRRYGDGMINDAVLREEMGWLNSKIIEELETRLKELDKNEGSISFAAPVADSIDQLDFLESIRQGSEQERGVHNSLNQDFLTKFNKERHESYRNAICKALNAENLYSENGGESE